MAERLQRSDSGLLADCLAGLCDSFVLCYEVIAGCNIEGEGGFDYQVSSVGEGAAVIFLHTLCSVSVSFSAYQSCTLSSLFLIYTLFIVSSSSVFSVSFLHL